MTSKTLAVGAAIAAAVLCPHSLQAQYSTPAANKEDLAAYYTSIIDRRTTDILLALGLSDSAKSNRVHEVIMAQYRALKTRDEAIDDKLKEMAKQGGGKDADRAGLFQTMSKSLHDQFLTKLGTELTPDQVETVKDKMTYGKVKFTYDAYCGIVPGLTDEDKAKIMGLLKSARDEAIDGGSAKEKSDIFQKYKDQIDQYLDAHGHDVAKAKADWTAKQALAKKQPETPAEKQAPSPH